MKFGYVRVSTSDQDASKRSYSGKTRGKTEINMDNLISEARNHAGLVPFGETGFKKASLIVSVRKAGRETSAILSHAEKEKILLELADYVGTLILLSQRSILRDTAYATALISTEFCLAYLRLSREADMKFLGLCSYILNCIQHMILAGDMEPLVTNLALDIQMREEIDSEQNLELFFALLEKKLVA